RLALDLVRDLRDHRVPTSAEELAGYEADVLADERVRLTEIRTRTRRHASAPLSRLWAAMRICQVAVTKMARWVDAESEPLRASLRRHPLANVDSALGSEPV